MSLDMENAKLEAELLSGDSGSGIKREFDGGSGGPDAKKGNYGEDSLLEDGKISEEFPIPDQLVGLVIGRGGENIQRIQQQTNCGIQVQAQSTGADNRPCTLTGNPEQVAAAKKMLQDVIVNGKMKDEQNKDGGSTTTQTRPERTDRRQQGGNNRQHNNSESGGNNNRGHQNRSENHNNHQNQQQQRNNGPPQPWQSTTEEFLVPSDKVGVVIGKGGQNLKNLRTKFNVQLELIQKDSDPPGVARPLKISGTLQQINGTRMECFTNMLPKEEKTPQKMAPGAQVRSDFPVPQGAVGVIIGKKGETITNLQGDTVTRIQFKPEEAGSQIRGCYITGSMDGVYRAQQIVMGICRKKMTGIDTLQNFGPPNQGFNNQGGGGNNMPRPSGPMMGGPPQNTPMNQQMNWNGPPRPPMNNSGGPFNQGGNGNMPQPMMNQQQYNQPIPPRPPQPEQQVDYPVPSHKTGAVIGKGGEHIIAIKNQTGCQITQNKTNPPSNDPQWKYFTIRGQPDKVAQAQKLIQERVGGPPPPGANFQPGGPPAPRPSPQPGIMGTGPPRPINSGYHSAPPVQPGGPPFGGPPQMPPQMPSPHVAAAPPVFPSTPNAPPVVPHSQMPAQPYQQATPTYPPQAPPAQALPVQQPPPIAQPQAPQAQQTQDHSAAWAAYYQQYYQQQQQARPAPAAATPTSATQAAQPDYTKAWEEYFKQQAASGGASASPAAAAASPVAAAATPTAGQPDYSAAWAEYYKTMGQYQQYYQQNRA